MIITVDLAEEEAKSFAQFLKRASFKDFRDCAVVWRDDRPLAIPRENVLTLEDLAKGKP